jgi:4a-hydroxytetrahydrobiopterin dehydratase
VGVIEGPEVAGWEVVDGKLRRTLTFADFSEAFGFMTRVALVAEKLDHHPDWSNSWNRVDLAIVSHDQGGITEQCVEFATRVNRLLGE